MTGIREFDRAIQDFEKAATLIEGTEDKIEPDGLPNAQNIPVSTLHTNIWYHLGLAYYLQHDLENALRRRHNKPIDLDRTPKVDELIVEYLNEVFTVTLAGDQGEMLKGASGNSGVAEVEPPVVQPRSAGSPRSSQKHQNKVGSLKWVGKEVSVKAAWLYFELPLPDGCEGVTLSNRIFLELEANQVNTLNLREGKQKATLHFTREKPKATVSFAPDDSDESTQGD